MKIQKSRKPRPGILKLTNLPKSAENQVSIWFSPQPNEQIFRVLKFTIRKWFPFCALLLFSFKYKIEIKIYLKKVSGAGENPEVKNNETKLLWSALW